MKLFLSKIFGRALKQEPAPGQSSSRGFMSSVQGGSDSSVRAQLVHVVMRDLLRKSGIPPGWITCQPQVLHSRSKGSGIFVRLSVKHWDDRLMQYAFAFQKTLLTDIVRFEPKAASWLHGIAWQLEVAGSCPHTELPEKNFWLDAPALRTTGTVAAPISASVSVSGIAAIRPQAAPKIASRPIVISTPSAPFTLPVVSSAAHKLAPDTGNDVAQDLKRLFAARDNEPAWPTTNIMQGGYDGTEPAVLRGQ